VTALEEWFERYGESHRHPVNHALHMVCVPVIAITLLALLSLIPLPWTGPVNLGSLTMMATLFWYACLSRRHAAGMLIIAAVTGLALRHYPSLMDPRWLVALFALAWAGQFVGHSIEGRRPRFVDDLRFLFVGPLWVLDSVYGRLGLNR